MIVPKRHSIRNRFAFTRFHIRLISYKLLQQLFFKRVASLNSRGTIRRYCAYCTLIESKTKSVHD